MDQRAAKILVVDDEPSMREFLEICLSRDGHDVTTSSSGADAIRRLTDSAFDLIVTDLTMPGVDGMEVLRHACGLPHPPLVLMVTAFATTDTAIQAMKIGAYDYLTKPFKVEEIRMVVRRALERLDLTTENERLRDALRGVHRLDRMVGKAPEMQKVFDLVRKVAPTRTNVLVRGESGTGKELVAHALHNLSDRAAGPFVAVNCGAIPADLMESELFGHAKGAFTGALSEREGMFAAASGGTLFLDEIGELGLSMQVKLLRALQERSIRPVGSSQEMQVDARVIAATNRDLEAAVEAGEFRNDLYFRLNVVQIVLPPLRRRQADIPLLVQRFFERFNRDMKRGLQGVDPEALDWFLSYDYPGNVRELENLIERAVALETGPTVSVAHLPELSPGVVTGEDPDAFPASGIDLEQVVAETERRWIEGALRESGGVRRDAAKLLGISLRSLRYRLEKLGVALDGGED